MWRPDPEPLAAALRAATGLSFDARIITGGDYPGVEFFPAGHRPAESFSIVLTVEWRSLQVSFRPGPYASGLVGAMGTSGETARGNFARFTEVLVGDRATVALGINGAAANPREPARWPTDWSRLELRLRRSPATVNTEDHAANDREVIAWLGTFVSLVVSLLPLEMIEEEAFDRPEGLPEGACVRIEANRYERSRVNRANCIALHGCRCKACGFDFEETYGELGRGFIHVHHVTPVSQLGAGYIVDPWTDLVPLCANCHAMAHRSDPPASVELLRDMRAGRHVA